MDKRIKSLLWRTTMMTLAGFINYALQNLGMLELSQGQTVMLGLVLGEVSKYLNSKV